MTIFVEQLSVLRVFEIAVAIRFGWYFADLAVEQVDHWIDLVLKWLRGR